MLSYYHIHGSTISTMNAGLLVERAGMAAALGAFAPHRGAAVALDGDIRYRPKI
jgi:hypothetical protein